MSREIRYRVYSNCYKKYLDTSGKGIFCEVHHLALKPDGKLYYADIGIDYPGTLSECPTLEWKEDYDDCVVEQYTGLKDKNGKEIYEGDIVKVYLHDTRWKSRGKYSVFWDNLHAYYVLSKSEDTEEANFRLGGYEYKYGVIRYEVIGNIHENPELLEYK